MNMIAPPPAAPMLDLVARRLAQLEAAAPDAPPILLHLAAHLMGDAAIGETGLRAFGHAILRAAESVDMPVLTVRARADCYRVATAVRLAVARREGAMT